MPLSIPLVGEHPLYGHAYSTAGDRQNLPKQGTRMHCSLAISSRRSAAHESSDEICRIFWTFTSIGAELVRLQHGNMTSANAGLCD